jgi:2-hydroxychromene-2-carboxylate isomerase
MTLTYDLFWSFRSPYSYKSIPRLIELESTYDVVARVRPVYPIAVCIDGFFKTVNPLWWHYLRRDVVRTRKCWGSHSLGPFIGRTVVWNPCRGNHLGQRSCASASTGRRYGRKT